jgi:hypothetical protein
MSGLNEIVDLIKQMLGKIIEYISNNFLGCDETAQSLREHIYFSTPWFMHYSYYWSRLLNDLELNKESEEKVLKYFVVLSDLDPVTVEPENEEFIKKIVIDSIQLIIIFDDFFFLFLFYFIFFYFLKKFMHLFFLSHDNKFLKLKLNYFFYFYGYSPKKKNYLIEKYYIEN